MMTRSVRAIGTLALLSFGCGQGAVRGALAKAGALPGFEADPLGVQGRTYEQCDDDRASGKPASPDCLESAVVLRKHQLWEVALRVSHDACAVGAMVECYWEGVVLLEGRPDVPADPVRGRALLESLCARRPANTGAVAACLRVARLDTARKDASAQARAEAACSAEAELGSLGTPRVRGVGSSREMDTALGYYREDRLGVRNRSAGGACADVADDYRDGQHGFVRDIEQAKAFDARAKTIIRSESSARREQASDEWSHDLTMCLDGKTTAMQCASRVCPKHCADRRCLASCTDDATRIESHSR